MFSPFHVTVKIHSWIFNIVNLRNFCFLKFNIQLFSFLENNMKFVLVVFSDNLFNLNQRLIFGSSAFRLVCNTLLFFFANVSTTSLAYSVARKFFQFVRSFIYTRKNICPSTLPCETPILTPN